MLMLGLSWKGRAPPGMVIMQEIVRIEDGKELGLWHIGSASEDSTGV